MFKGLHEILSQLEMRGKLGRPKKMEANMEELRQSIKKEAYKKPKSKNLQ